eukprot:8447148-Lingulodinium_polyedra.AAC.1
MPCTTRAPLRCGEHPWERWLANMSCLVLLHPRAPLWSQDIRPDTGPSKHIGPDSHAHAPAMP